MAIDYRPYGTTGLLGDVPTGLLGDVPTGLWGRYDMTEENF